MAMPCGKYFVVMLPQWLPLLLEAGDLDHPFATPEAIDEVRRMSAATVDRYLAPARAAFELKGRSATGRGCCFATRSPSARPATSSRMSPECWSAAPSRTAGRRCRGEFARTLTMTDMSSGRTECGSIRNNASKWILEAVEGLREEFPFPVTGFDTGNGSEFINRDVADWLQKEDIAFTRSRPCKKNDQATVESKNNHVVRKHAFYWRYDTTEERELLNRLWRMVSLRMNFFTPTKKPIGYDQTAGGRRRHAYDQPKTPWQRVKCSGIPVDIESVEARIPGINHADLIREINAIQQQLTHLAAEKTRALTQTRRLDMASLEKSIKGLQPRK